MPDETPEIDVAREFERAALQLAMYQNRLDVAEYGTASWDVLDVTARAGYLRESKRTIGALGMLGWAPLHPHGALYLRDPRDTLKMLRETLAVAQSAINATVGMPASDAQTEWAATHVERLGRIIAEIDRLRPLGPDGKHGDLHTASCGCEDR